jgi:hypothetical protein
MRGGTGVHQRAAGPSYAEPGGSFIILLLPGTAI